MRTVCIYKAQTSGDQPIESVMISVENPFPRIREADWLEGTTRLFDAQAAAIVDALHSLPGGTLDRVFVKLLAEKVSQHIVPWEKRG